MGYRIISILLVAFMVTGFSWGRKKEDEQPVKSTTQKYTSTSSSSTMSKTAKQNASTAAAPADGEFPSELIGALAKGNEQERRARIESLKRLSTALSDMKKKSAEGEAAVASTETVQKSSWRTSY